MSIPRVSKALEYIDDDFISDAATFTEKRKSHNWIKWTAMVACLSLILAGVLLTTNYFKNNDIGKNNTYGSGEVMLSKPPLNKNNEASPNNSSDSEIHKPADSVAGIRIPAIKLPKTSDTVEFDMIAALVYNGGIYTEAESYYGREALRIDNLMGEYLGYATGSIDEESTQEDYAKEFASTISGEVYEVIGYDTDFRVCVRKEIEDTYGEKQLFIMILERVNGITLATGEDLFESRLHIHNQVDRIQWQSHDDWNEAKGNLQSAEISPELWEEFLNQVDHNMFIYLWNEEDIDANTIYNTPKQAHIYVTMEDGTVNHIRLIDGGYVGYAWLGWYFVQIPEEIFDEIFTACGGNTQ